LWTSTFIIYRFALFTFTVYRIVILTYRIKWSTRILAITFAFSITRRITVSLVIQRDSLLRFPSYSAKNVGLVAKYFAGDKSLSNECPQTLKSFKCQSSLCHLFRHMHLDRVMHDTRKRFMIMFCVLEI
jgi:hypothetical protein